MKKIAVFGYSVMSLEVMSRINREQFTIIFSAKNNKEADLVTEKGYTATVIDFRNDDDLKSIGIGSSIDILFCFFPDDSENVFLTISARVLDPELTIVSIIDDPDSSEILLAAGADKIIDPYEICGRKTYEILTKPGITDIMDHAVFGRYDLNITQVEIPEGSPLENTASSELTAHEKYNLILIGIVQNAPGQPLHFVIGEKAHGLKAGDVLVVMGPSQDCKDFKKQIEIIAG